MRIDGKPSLPTPLAAQAARPGAPARRFEVPGGRPSRPEAVAASAPLATMDAILALQGEHDPGERRRKAARRGQEILDDLDRLRAGLLGGRVAAADLRSLAARLTERRDATGSEGLDEALAQIEIRAQVELAKLGL